jgi:hypothetical protein
MDVSIDHVALELRDLGQFSGALFGCDVRKANTPDPDVIHEDAESDEDDVDEPEEKCQVCRKSCYCPNKLMADHIKRCQKTMKSSRKSIQHF